MFVADELAWSGAEDTVADPGSRQLSECSDDELTDAVCQLHNLITASEAEMLRLVGELDRRKAYLDDGCRNIASWLTARLVVSGETARKYARVAAALPSLPRLEEAFSTGRVSLDQLAPVVRIANPENDAILAEELPGYSVAQAETLSRRARAVAPADEAEAHARRFISLRREGQCTRVSGRLAGFDAETVRVALERIAEGLPVNPETGRFDPYRARMADALVGLAAQHIAEDSDPDRADVVVHVDKSVLEGEDGPVESGDGGELSAEAARRAACDCRYHLWVRDNLSGSLDLGRTTRSIPTHMSRYLRHRDGGCRFPGCGSRRLLHGHHIVHWGHGGPTDRSNLALQCHAHHRLVHEGGWHVEGDAERTLTYVSPDGRRIESRRAPFRDDVRQRFFEPDPPPVAEGGVCPG